MLSSLKTISPQWWGAIAAAVAAGATLFADNRLVGGAAFGAGMFLLARKASPCCASCADSHATSSTAGNTASLSESRTSLSESRTVWSAPESCASCGGLDEVMS